MQEGEWALTRYFKVNLFKNICERGRVVANNVPLLKKSICPRGKAGANKEL